MIIPIGHEDSGTRRRPWVTIGIIVACTGAWIATLHGLSKLERLPPEHYREQARLYWEANPYLDIERNFATYMILHDHPDALSADEPFAQEQWELWLLNKRLRSNARLRDQGAAARSGQDVLAQQEELDRLIAYGFYLEPEQIPPEGVRPSERFGLTPSEPTWYGFVTHVFMHNGWVHILGNLLLLFLAAPALEDRWGRPLFALFYLSAGVFAGAFHMVLALDSGLPLVGASGAIAGVLGAFLVLFWKSRVKFAYYFFPPFFGTFLLPAWICLPLWFANEIGNAWLSQANLIQSNVAYWAHVSGFLFGSLCAMMIRGMRLEERFLERSISRKVIRSRSGGMLAEARKALANRNFEHAFLVLQQEVEDQPGKGQLLLAFLEAAVAFYKPEAAARPLEAWLRGRATGKHVKEAAEVWARAVEIWPGFDLDPDSLIQLVAPLRRMKRDAHAALALRYVISAEHAALPVPLSLRVRELARDLDPEIELAALRRACAGGKLPGPKRDRLEKAISQLEGRGIANCPDPLNDEMRRIRRVERDENGAIPIDSLDHDPSGVSGQLSGVAGELLPRFGGTKLVDAVPLEVAEEHLVIRTGDGRQERLEFARIQGLGAAIVGDLSAEPVLVIDLLLNWNSVVEDTLQIVRLRGNAFDPTSLFAGAGSGVEALVELIRCVLRRSGADPLPSERALLSGAFDHFDSLAAYERAVLEVERP